MDIYFSSDFHFDHKNIVRGCSEWTDKKACRDFDSLEEHNTVLVENINKVVKADDILYFNGDWSFGGIANVLLFRRMLNVKNIHFVGGNHDHHIRENKALRRLDENGQLMGFVNAQNVFASYNEILEKTISGQMMVLCHYPMRSWHKASKGSWMLFGHEHDSLPEYTVHGGHPASNKDLFKTMDIGIDTHPEFRPYHLDEIRAKMNNRLNLGNHHNGQE